MLKICTLKRFSSNFHTMFWNYNQLENTPEWMKKLNFIYHSHENWWSCWNDWFLTFWMIYFPSKIGARLPHVVLLPFKITKLHSIRSVMLLNCSLFPELAFFHGKFSIFSQSYGHHLDLPGCRLVTRLPQSPSMTPDNRRVPHLDLLPKSYNGYTQFILFGTFLLYYKPIPTRKCIFLEAFFFPFWVGREKNSIMSCPPCKCIHSLHCFWQGCRTKHLYSFIFFHKFRFQQTEIT